MAKYKIANCIVEYSPFYDLLKKQLEPYKYIGEEKYDFCLELNETFYQTKLLENPHLTLAQCEYIFAGSYFYRYLLKYHGFMLHASAVEVDGKAYLFSASSGTGKSTHTKLWQEYFGYDKALIINDDKPALKFEAGKWYVYGTPFSGKSDKNLTRKILLKSICMIERGLENKIWSISGKEAIALIIQQTILPRNNLLVNNLLDLISDLLDRIPIYRMQCNISLDAVELAYKKMNEEIEDED